MNEFTTILRHGETPVLLDAQNQLAAEQGTHEFQIPGIISRLHYSETGFNLFFLRLPGVFLFIFLLCGFYWYGKKLFGLQVVLSTMIVLSSTFLIVPLSKFAVYDLWLLVFQMPAFLFLILLLKQGTWKWRILFWVSVVAGMLTEPVSTLLFVHLSWLFFLLFHRNRKNIGNLFDWGFWLLLYLGFYFFGGFSGSSDGFVIHFKEVSPTKYLLFNLLALLPWIGFLPAALWDLIMKLRKKDEMALITFAWLLFGLLGFGLLFQLALVFLLGKQVVNYFKPNYPYRNLVKTFSVLSLVVAFIALTVFMLGGYAILDTVGFRSAVGLSIFYWAFSFIAVIGLFAHRRKLIVGGMALSGVFAMLLFWIQVNPVIDLNRNLAKKIVYEIEELQGAEQLPVYFVTGSEENRSGKDAGLYDQVEVYANAKKLDFEYRAGMDFPEPDRGIYVLNESTYQLTQNQIGDGFQENPVVGYPQLFSPERKFSVFIIE